MPRSIRVTDVRTPKVTVVVAARNAAATIASCLEAVCAQAGDEAELIVVDDCSCDGTAVVASRYPITLISLAEHRGVAAARNEGAAAARAPVLFFLDADVVLAPGALARGMAAMADPAVDAVIGSYDDQPQVGSIVNRFKNLAHHYFHQRSPVAAATFWGACGLIRRDLFVAVGGFDAKRYVLPSIEDIEIGYRLLERGARIQLDRGLQVKHLKGWTIGSLLKADVWRRAIPWTRLVLERNAGLPNHLNLTFGQRLAAAVAIGLAVTLPAAVFREWARVLSALLLVAAFWINRDLFGLFYRKGGLRFALAGFVLQQFYYLYAACGLAAGVMLHYARRVALGRSRMADARPGAAVRDKGGRA